MPSCVTAIPFAMVDVVTQLLEDGVEYGAAGVARSPTVYTEPPGSVPVYRWANVEKAGAPFMVAVGYHPGGSSYG